jgi:tetratricopeptide (TPR) repeat protein
MRTASTALMVVGFGIGFAIMYTYVSPRAAEISRPLPQFTPQTAAGAAQVNPEEIRQLEDLLRAEPRNFEALRRLGNLRYDERNFNEAAALYAQALEVQDDPNVRSDRGGALLQGNRIDEAIVELQNVLNKEPTHAQALYIMGVALLEGRRDHAGALAHWNKLVESHPDLPELNVIKRQIQQVEELSREK